MRKEIKTKLSNVIDEWFCVDQFLNRIGCDLYTLLKNLEDSEELMKCIRDDTFIYVRSSKDFKIA